jgi:photosystem II stability/assembly factor-like uncharacterized protein
VLVGVLGAANASVASASGWSIQPTPNPAGARNSGLGDISCTSERACTAVGASSKGALIERWNGRRWSIQQHAIPAGAVASSLGGVSCPSANTCIAVGGYHKGRHMTLAERWSG